MNKYKVCCDGNKPLIYSFFIDALETMRVKVLERGKGSGGVLMPGLKQSLEQIQSHKEENRGIVMD